MDPWLQADQIADRLLDPTVEGDDEVDGLDPVDGGGEREGPVRAQQESAGRVQEVADGRRRFIDVEKGF